MKKIAATGLALMLAFFLFYAARGESAATESDWPQLNEQGFLDEGEFLYMDDKEGLWRYCSDTLWVEVRRIIQARPARTWYEAEIRCAEGADTPRMIPLDPEKWMTAREYPYKLTRKTRTVIAISADYAWHRIINKTRAGIIIRDGKVYSERTRKKGAKQFPNLDTLALFPDGDMQVFDSDEKTAQEYLDMGARDVLAFGPWLIRDGELNEAGLKQYGKSSAERVAVGMVEKGHYWFMMLEGRIKRSKGDGIDFLTEKMQEKGCRTAFNLDGGRRPPSSLWGISCAKWMTSPATFPPAGQRRCWGWEKANWSRGGGSLVKPGPRR